MTVKLHYLQIAVWLVCLPFFCVNAQTEIRQKPSIVKGFSFDFNGDGKWEVDEGANGKWVDELRIMGTMELSRKLKVVAVDEIRFDQSKTTNKITRAFISYGNVFKFNKEKLPVPQSISLNLKAGLLEWYPSLSDPRLIAENIEKYFTPESFYGGSIQARMPIDRKELLTAYIGAHSGDVLGGKVEPAIQDAYVMLKLPLIKNTAFDAQFGKYQGSIHFVNYCYINYKPQIEKVRLDLRAGKLPALDQSPYGVHLGLTRPFNFIEIGGYYQRRLNMVGNRQIFGFTWRFLRPEKLVEIMNAYNFIYDTNTNTLRFIIPFININMKL